MSGNWPENRGQGLNNRKNSLRTHLAQKGLKKGDLSKFIEEAVRWRVFHQTVEDTKARNTNVPQEEIDAAIDEALTAVRAERFSKRD